MGGPGNSWVVYSLVVQMLLAGLGGGECASDTTHDRTEERGVEVLFCAASITPKCYNVIYIASNGGVTPYAGAGCEMCGEKT